MKRPNCPAGHYVGGMRSEPTSTSEASRQRALPVKIARNRAQQHRAPGQHASPAPGRRAPRGGTSELSTWQRWPLPPRQSARTSRATELADRFSSHVRCAWLGRTGKVADTFYRSTTDEHYARAAARATISA